MTAPTLCSEVEPADAGAIGSSVPTLEPDSGPSSPRVRVLHLINGEHYSGAERVQDLLGLRLPSEGFDVGFACVKPDRFPGQRLSRNCPLYLTPMSSRGSLAPVGELTRIVRGEGYQLLHAHTPRTALLG
ncbi:MAG TPA: glycosyltransferase family 1 protein, partial [Pirellulaceae bacterium]